VYSEWQVFEDKVGLFNKKCGFNRDVIGDGIT
jgi:hypothetical protein